MNVESFLKLAQVAAIAGTAGWTLWAFLSFQSEQEKLRTDQMRLANEQQELNNRQIKALAETDKETKRITLEQQKLTLRQAELTAASETERAKVSLEQQKFTLAQNKLLSDTDIERAKTSAQILELEKALKTSQVKDVQQGRIAAKVQLNIKCESEPGQYFGTLFYHFENASKTNVEISWTLLHRFIGTLSSEREDDSIIQVNDPPTPILGLEAPGPIVWKEVGHQGALYPGTAATAALRRTRFRFRAGGGTKDLRPGDYAGADDNFVIASTPGKWVATVLSVGIDAGTSAESVFHYRRWERLSTCDSEKELKNKGATPESRPNQSIERDARKSGPRSLP